MQTISTPTRTSIDAIRCHTLQENCTFIRQLPWSMKNRHRSEQSLIASRSTTTISSSSSLIYHRFSRNFKLIALIITCIAIGLVILRLCLLACHKSSRISNHRHTSIVRPQIAVVEQNYVKLDLPPAYADAMASYEQRENKLPSYDELQGQQSVRTTTEYLSTQV
jgi:hypothetical protein